MTSHPGLCRSQHMMLSVSLNLSEPRPPRGQIWGRGGLKQRPIFWSHPEDSNERKDVSFQCSGRHAVNGQEISRIINMVSV